MHFLNPIALVGLAAALVPLAIHLLHRGRPQSIPFSNLQFLEALHQSRMRRLQLRQWLVLLLRTLAIGLIALAFSRPTYRGGGLLGGAIPVSAVVLVDRSFSTRYRLPAGRQFDRIRQQALDLLELFNERDRVTVLPFAATAGPPLEEAGGALGERLSELAPSEQVTDLLPALEAAGQILAEAGEGIQRELFVLGDLCRTDWTRLPAAQSGQLPGVEVYVAVPPESTRPNLSLTQARLDSWLQAPGKRLTVGAQVTNHSPSESRFAVDLFVDGERVQRRSVTLEAGERQPLEMAFSPRRAGRLTGHLELEGDDLHLDDRRYFTLSVPAPIGVLIAGKEPTDTYYARAALTAAAAADPALRVRAGLLSELTEAALDSADVLLLCNLRHLDRQWSRPVLTFVERGGGLILFPGPDADLSRLNRDLLSGVAPALLQKVAGSPGSEQTHARLDLTRSSHPALVGLGADEDGQGPRISAFYQIASTRPVSPFLWLADGRAAAVEGWKGSGRTVLFALPLSAAWSEMPIHGLFPSLLHRLVRYLALPVDHQSAYRVGDSVRRYLAGTEPTDAIQVQTPGGRRLYLEPRHVEGRLYWEVGRVDEAGLWRLLRDEEALDAFAVNVDADESDLTPADPVEVDRVFGPGRAPLLHPGDELAEVVLSRRYGRELWRECLALAVVLLLLELWLARAPQGRPRERAPEG